MASFDDLFDLDPYQDEDEEDYTDPSAVGPYPRTQFGGAVDSSTARRVLAEADKRKGYGPIDFAENAVTDVLKFGKDVGGAIQAVWSNPFAAGRAVKDAAMDPRGTISSMADFYRQEYESKEGELPGTGILRHAYEKPFSTAMDLSGLLQAPAGVAKLLGKVAGTGVPATFETLAHAGRSIDPIVAAARHIKPIIKSKRPGLFAKMEAKSEAADAYAEQTRARRTIKEQGRDIYHDPETGVYAGLNQAEKMALRPYGEGRFQFLPSAMNEVDPEKIRPHMLDAALKKAAVAQDDLDRAEGLLPEQAVQARTKALMRELEAKGLDPTSPEYADELFKGTKKAGEDAQMAYDVRRTVSMRTLLDVNKHSAWERKLGEDVAANIYADIETAKSYVPHPITTTPQEALEVMGKDGGVIFSHSMEVLNRSQSTVSGITTKLGEAGVWFDKEGEIFKRGLVDIEDPAAAFQRAYLNVHNTASMGHVAYRIVKRLEGAGEGFATKLKPGAKTMFDPDLVGDAATGRAATHQLFSPGAMHLRDVTGGEFNKFLTRVLEVGDDAAVAELNLPELSERFAKGQLDIWQLKPEVKSGVWKVRQEAATAFAEYEKSLRPSTDLLSSVSDSILGPWHFGNLNLFASRLLNEGLSNVAFVTIQGVNPATPRGLDAYITAGRAMLAKKGVLTDPTSKKLADIFKLPGLSSAALPGDETLGWFGDWLQRSKNPGLRLVGNWGGRMKHATEQLESFFRAASLVYEIKPTAMKAAKEMLHSQGAMQHFADYVTTLKGKGAAALTHADYKHALENVDHYLANHDRVTALERTTLRHIAPYNRFYKHAAKLLLQFPFEHPAKAAVARHIGRAARDDAKEILKGWGFDWNTEVPEHLRNAVPVSMEQDENGTPTAVMLNLTGPNPFSFASGNDLGELGLALVSPVVKLAFEQVTGVNLFTLRRFMGPNSENVNHVVNASGEMTERYTRPNFVENLLRQFRVYNTAKEYTAKGRMPTDTASLLDMIEDAPGTWQLDDRGFAKRRPQPLGAATALSRFGGITPTVLQAPTMMQQARKKSELTTALADLFQTNPEMQTWIMEEIARLAQEPDHDAPSEPLTPRLF